MTVRFYTHKAQVPLQPGERIGFRKGRGYYARPAPKPPASVFSGVGLFTAHDPRSALRFQGVADWVLLQGDPEGGYQTGDATVLEKAGFRVMEWQARASQVTILPHDVRLRGYVGQAEGPSELQACLALNPAAPRGLVGKPDNWAPDNSIPLPAGWDLLYEWYQVDDGGFTYANRNYAGNPVSSVVVGVYHGYRLQQALDQVPRGTSISVYLAETCTAEDIEALKAWRA